MLMQKLPNHRHEKAGKKSPIVNVSNFLSTRCHPGPYAYEGLCGKNTGRLLSEASIGGDKKIKIPACASLK